MSTIKKTLLLATPVVIICGGFAYDYLMTNITFIPSSERRARSDSG
jgi:phosphoribosylformylglycinamidine (FGAM) synthase-like amidotransferase family enzyme